MLGNCDKIMLFCFNFDTCPMHSPFGLAHLKHQNLSASALFCHNSIAKVNTRLFIYKYSLMNGCDLKYFFHWSIVDKGTHKILATYGTKKVHFRNFSKKVIVLLRSLKKRCCFYNV